MVESYGETIEKEEAQLAVDTYRKTHRKLVNFWNFIEEIAIKALQRPNNLFRVNKYISFIYSGDFLQMVLPSGRSLHYYLPQLEHGKYGLSITYMSTNEKSQFVRTHTYGGKLVENAVQAIARDVLVHAIRSFLSMGYRVITHVHDEVVLLGLHDLGTVEQIMCSMPDWAEGIPLEAEGFTTTRFKKG